MIVKFTCKKCGVKFRFNGMYKVIFVEIKHLRKFHIQIAKEIIKIDGDIRKLKAKKNKILDEVFTEIEE